MAAATPDYSQHGDRSAQALAPDYYQRLGVPRDASNDAIKKAYRKLALKHHPDKGGDANAFKAYAEAYAVLSAPDKRKVYDATGEASLVDLDLDGMMAECFADGGVFEQMIAADPEMRELAEEEGMEGMQRSFGSFFAATMGGGGPVYMPDGSVAEDMPRIKMPSLQELMDGATDPEELELMKRVSRKMGIGERGALVPGTGLQALNVLQTLGSDPSFWSDGDEDEDEDAFLDDLKAELQQRGNAPAASTAADGAQAAAPRTGIGSQSGANRGSTRDDDAPVATASGQDLSGPARGSCTAPSPLGKAWLDLARQGRLREMQQMHEDEPSLVHFHGAGLGQTALHWACTKADARTATWLLSAGSSIDARNANGASPLHAAASAGSSDCVELLLAAGARVAARDSEGRSCLQLASAHGHTAVACQLAEAQQAGSGGAGVAPRRSVQLVRTGGTGALDVQRQGRRQGQRPQRPLEAEAEAGAEEATALRTAARGGDVAAVAEAVKSEAGRALVHVADSDGLTLLHLAARSGSAGCVATLLGCRADGAARSKKGNTALAVACKHAQWAAVDALLDGGVTADGLAMYFAVRRNAAAATQQRLAHAGGLDAPPPDLADARSALMTAAASGDASTVEALLELRADVSLVDANGASALHYCADRGDTACALLLCRSGARINAVDSHGNTALHAAGRRGKTELFAALLEAGADAEALNDRGRPPKLLDAADADAACAVM